MRLKTYEEMNAEQQMAYDIGVATFKASLTSPETIEKLVSWIEDASGALGAATTIGMRSCRPGDGLHYANHDRLIREAKELVAVLRSVEEGKT